MTVFGVIWFVSICYAFSKKNPNTMLCVTLLYMTFQCSSVLDYRGIGVGPQLLTSLAFIAKYLLTKKGKIYKIQISTLNMPNVFLVLLLLEIVISTVYNQVMDEKILLIIQLSIYIFCFICIKTCLKEFCEINVYKIVRGIIIFISIMGVIQVIVSSGWLPLNGIMKQLFFNEEESVYFNRVTAQGLSRLYSIFMEPSYFAGFVVGAFYYLLSIKEKWKDNFMLLCVLFFEIILTKSSSGYGAMLIIGVFFVVFSRGISIWWKMLAVIIAIMAAMFFYFSFYDLLDQVIFSKNDSGSAITRAGWDKGALRAYFSSPMIGIGYKNIRGSSLIYSVLGQLGMVGMILYSLFIFASSKTLIFKLKSDSYVHSDHYGAIFALLTVVLCQIIACPDLDLCTFWFWAYVVAACEGGYMEMKRRAYERQYMESNVQKAR